jgi:hypothetical protein
MRKNRAHVIVWDHSNRLVLDLPRGTMLSTLSDGTLRATVPVPREAAAAPNQIIVDCVGRPLITKEPE